MIEQKIRKNKEVLALIRKGNDNLGAMGYTDHSKAHAAMVADRAAYILKKLDYPEKDIELVKIAGWMHDIGNAINRTHHAEYGALLANDILKKPIWIWRTGLRSFQRSDTTMNRQAGRLIRSQRH